VSKKEKSQKVCSRESGGNQSIKVKECRIERGRLSRKKKENRYKGTGERNREKGKRCHHSSGPLHAMFVLEHLN
jgi:hypothetical protein